ncbi:MAG: 50S ribosomal protein L24 [Nitrospirae bacterium RBG_13_39_12]|nr:MAG: 50S ribosomal protein L24 [Nitrospirae bacterium RBG_13_39_12]
MSLSIKKNDTVLIITGKEKGKKGRILSFTPSKGRVLVEKINMIKKHMKPSRKYTQGGIIEKEAAIHISNVMLICPKCSKPTGISNTFLQDGRKVRTCKKCREVMDE